MNEFRCCLSVCKPMLAGRTARVCMHRIHGRITHTSRQHLHTKQAHLHFFSVQLGRSHFLQPAVHVRIFFHSRHGPEVSRVRQKSPVHSRAQLQCDRLKQGGLPLLYVLCKFLHGGFSQHVMLFFTFSNSSTPGGSSLRLARFALIPERKAK